MKNLTSIRSLYLKILTSLTAIFFIFVFLQFILRPHTPRFEPDLIGYEIYFLILITTLFSLFVVSQLSPTLDDSPQFSFSIRDPLAAGLYILATLLLVQRSTQFDVFFPWMDEAAQFARARLHWAVRSGTLEHQPPLGHLISGAQALLLGNSTLAMRAGALLSSWVAVLAFYLFIFELTGSVAVAALVAFALNFDPTLAIYSFEARPIAEAMLGLICYLYFSRHWQKRLDWRDGIVVGVITCFLVLTLGGQTPFILCALALTQFFVMIFLVGIRKSALGVLPTALGFLGTLPILIANVRYSPPRFNTELMRGFETYIASFQWKHLVKILYPTKLWPIAICATLLAITWLFSKRLRRRFQGQNESMIIVLILVVAWWVFPLLYMPLFRGYISWWWELVKYYCLNAVVFWTFVGLLMANLLRLCTPRWRPLGLAAIIALSLAALVSTENFRLSLNAPMPGNFFRQSEIVANDLLANAGSDDWIIPLTNEPVDSLADLVGLYSLMNRQVRYSLYEDWQRRAYKRQAPPNSVLIPILKMLRPLKITHKALSHWPIEKIQDYQAYRLIYWDIKQDPKFEKLIDFLESFKVEFMHLESEKIQQSLSLIWEYQAALNYYVGNTKEAESLMRKTGLKSNENRVQLVGDVYSKAYPQIFSSP